MSLREPTVDKNSLTSNAWGCALLCGVMIGVERQWRQRTVGLRTYTLVAAGLALFVMLAALTPGE